MNLFLEFPIVGKKMNIYCMDNYTMDDCTISRLQSMKIEYSLVQGATGLFFWVAKDLVKEVFKKIIKKLLKQCGEKN